MDNPSGPAENRFEAWLSKFESIAIAVLSLIALAIGTMQVVLRYVFNTGFSWTEGIFVMLTIWAMLIAGSRAVRDGLHVRVDIALHFAPAGAVRAFNLIGVALSFVLSGYFAYCGYLYVRFVWSIDAVSQEANLPEWIIYGIVPLSMGLFCIRYLQRFIEWARGGAAPLDQRAGDHTIVGDGT